MKSAAALTVVIALAVPLAAPPAALAAGTRAWFAAPAGAGTTCRRSAPCSLQQACAKAGRGDRVYLATGTYTAVGPAAEVLSLTRGVKLLGGWDGTATSPPVRSTNSLLTLLDGEDLRRVVKIQGPGVSVTLDGLTIYRGKSTDRGGGVWASEANLTLRRVVVLGNHVTATAANNLDFGGGGVYVAAGRLKVATSFFAGNGADNTNGYDTYGGAILLKDVTRAEVVGSVFGDNDARKGSGIGMRALDETADPTPVTVRRCAFIDNGRGISGAGLGEIGGGLDLERAAATISRSTFTGNAVTLYGAAVYHHYGMLKMDRNTITGNAAGQTGVIEVFSGNGRLRNNVIADNAPGIDAEAAAVYLLRPGVKVTFIHNTIVGPSAGHRGSGVAAVNDAQAVMVNNILARFDEGVYAWSSSEISVAGTLWGTGAWANASDTAADGYASSLVTLGAGNTSGLPDFLDPAVAGPWRIGPASAARNGALATSLAVDVDGEPRGAKRDIGADEYMTRVLLLAPNGGQSLREGTSLLVRWGAPTKAETFKLSYSKDGGASWKLIAKGLTGRAAIWNLPTITGTSTTCLVRVIGYASGGTPVGSDVSDAFFTIRDVP